VSLKLVDAVHDILKLVAEVSGKPIEFIEKEDLPTFAGIRMARKDMPAHLLLYKREHDDLVNHLVAHECGHILRLFKESAGDRRVYCFTQDAKKVAVTQLTDEINALSKTMDEDRLIQMVNLWLEGNVKQVTSFPADLMIERWMYQEYPSLRSCQLKSIERQRNEGLAGLKTEVASITPPTLLAQSNIMNYAFFRLLGMEFGTNLVSRYSGTPIVAKGKQLAELTAMSKDEGLLGDIALSEKWAEFLGMKGWYEWVPLE
jgi:hypothetical protein